MSTNVNINSSAAPQIDQFAIIPKNEIIGKNGVLDNNNALSNKKDLSLNISSGIKSEDLSKLNELLVLNKPSLTNSQANLDPDTAFLILADAFDKQSTQGIENNVKNLKSSLEYRSHVNEEKLKKFQEQIKKQEEEAKSKATQQGLSDAMLGLSIFAAIAGVVASIFTFGAAAPAIAVAIVGLGMTSLDAANRIVQATGATYDDPSGKKKNLDISISGLIRMTTEYDLSKNPPLGPNGKKLEGQDLENEINKRVLAATIVVNILLMAGMVAGGAGAGYIAKEAAKKAIDGGVKASNSLAAAFKPETAQFINSIATATQAGSEVNEGIMGVSTNIYGIQIASITFKKNELSNQKDQLEAWAKIITGEINSDQDSLTEKIKAKSEMWEIFADAISSYNESRSKAINSV